MSEKKIDLCIYRIANAIETLRSLHYAYYKDSINRSYYASFYAIKSSISLR